MSQVPDKALVVPGGPAWNELQRILPLLIACRVVPAGNDAPGFEVNSQRTEMVLKLKESSLPEGTSELGLVTIVASNGTFLVIGKLTGQGSGGGGGGALPPGGADGEVLTKQSAADGDADWEAPAGGITWRHLSGSLASYMSGDYPTDSEISAALAAVYTSGSLTPANGDLVRLTLAGGVKLIALISVQSVTASGEFVRSFTVSSTDYYAVLWQAGLF